MSNVYDADYFLRGKKSGKSLYEDYRWMPELTIPMVQRIIEHLGIYRTETILDFGCARGYIVKAFRQLGYMANGVDASEWAISNCDQSVKKYLWHSDTVPQINHDWVIAKDVLEHVEPVQDTITRLMERAKVGIFAVVPLAGPDGRYVVSDYELDVTHIHRVNLGKWASAFMDHGWEVNASFRVKGIKDNYYKPGWEKGNGFITATRVKE